MLRRSLSTHLHRISGPSEAYRIAHARSISHPEDFWAEAASEITWFKKYNKVLETTARPHGKWFSGGELNVCYNAVDRHVENGFGEQTAIVYDSPVTKTIQSFSYRQLQESVSRLASQLASMGVRKGDRVLIYMPMIPESIHAMLACTRLGAVHVYVFGGFAAKELSTRIRHTEPKVILSASCGIEPGRIVRYKPMLDEAIRLANIPSAVQCLIYQRPGHELVELQRGRDFDWSEAMEGQAQRGHDCVPVDADDAMYIMYTSGTTGTPKGIVRATGGHSVALPWTMRAVYDMRPGETWWAASDLGWVVGHSYTCYGPLLSRITSVLYEGKPVGTPDAAQFYRVIQDHGVNGMFTAPTALRAIRKEDPENLQARGYSRKSLKYLFLAGERCDNDTRVWGEKSFQVPAIDHFWQTESGHAITSICVGLDKNLSRPAGTGGVALPGIQMQVRLDDGTVGAPGELGRLVCKLPLPPGFMKTLFRADELCTATYFQKYDGCYDTMDAGFIDEAGYVHIMARDDDVINIAGHRLSTSGIEEVILEHDDVADVAVVGVPDAMKGQVALALFVIAPGRRSAADAAAVAEDIVSLVRERIGPVAAFRLAMAVPALPRTRSGKTPRKSIAQLAEDNASVKIPPTIEDVTVYEHVIAALNKLGYGKNSKIEH